MTTQAEHEEYMQRKAKKSKRAIIERLDRIAEHQQILAAELASIKKLVALNSAAAQFAAKPPQHPNLFSLTTAAVANLSPLAVPALDRLQPLWPQPQPQTKARAEFDEACGTEEVDGGVIHKFHFKIG